MPERGAEPRKRTDVLFFVLALALHKLITGLSWKCARRLSVAAADLARALDRNARKHNTLLRLREAFPELHVSELRRIRRDVYRWLFESVVDALHYHVLLCSGRARQHVEMVNESGQPVPENKKGLVIVSGHFGWWEVGTMSLGMLGYPTAVIARRMKNALLEDYIMQLRETQGIQQLEKQGALRRGLKALKSGWNLAMMIDQDARHYGVFVDFFGKPASTYSSPASLSIFTGAPSLFFYCKRVGDGDRFRIILKDIVHPRKDADKDEEVRRIMQRHTSTLEELVRETPQCWLWLHRRWKTYPGKYVMPGGAGA